MCHGCELPIVGEPPIRTISSVSPTSEPTSGVHARVTNRHFSCPKASNVSWIPVSHVWEESIRTANQSKEHLALKRGNSCEIQFRCIVICTGAEFKQVDEE
ncbi:hypothetical protein B0H67DRAFT_586854 [Lasiosphaeris hirsuta]|uniref:Uncharacterized protein n=1 Tax=Lasiosphaeris hirsuta TaxID=260670 RepID=A0AA40DQ62_9PEZI|nr:hypothetical protein B0H67DRAFT_586854 [Lasiosphaeris hirsuta]